MKENPEFIKAYAEAGQSKTTTTDLAMNQDRVMDEFQSARKETNPGMSSAQTHSRTGRS